MGKLAVVCAVGAGLLLGGCQAVNTTNGGAVGVERKQYMFSMLSSQQVDQMYAQSYRPSARRAPRASWTRPAPTPGACRRSPTD